MPISVEVIRAEQRGTFTYPLRAVLRYDFPARGNVPPVSVYWYDGVHGTNLPYLYRPKGLENEVLLPRTNNLATEKGRPDLGSSGGRGFGGGGQGRGGGRSAAAAQGAVRAVAQSARPSEPTGGADGIRRHLRRRQGLYGHRTVRRRRLAASGRWVGRIPASPPILPRSPGHYRDWIRACKGGDPACSNFSVAGPYAEWVTLGAIAYRFEGKLEYDAKAGRFTNNAEANRYLKPVFRKGWEPKL